MNFLIICPNSSSGEKQISKRLINRLREHLELKESNFTKKVLETSTALNTQILQLCEQAIDQHKPDVVVFVEIEELDFETIFRKLHFEIYKGFYQPNPSPQLFIRAINTATDIEIKDWALPNFKTIYFSKINNVAMWVKNNAKPQDINAMAA